MKKRGKFIVSVVSLAVSMFFLLAGVYSAASKETNITGKISFTPLEVYLNYTVEATVPYETGDPDYSEIGTGSFLPGETNQGGKVVELGDVYLNDYQRFYSYKITFERISGFTREYYIDAEKRPIDGVVYTVTTSVSPTADLANRVTVAGTTQTVVITFSFEIKTNKTGFPTTATPYDLGAGFRLSV